MGKPKLEALYCSADKNLNISKDEMWKNYPWIFDNKTGKLYDYIFGGNRLSSIIGF